MSITWQERENEEQDMVALNNPGTVEALKNYGLLKYFKLSGNEATNRTTTVPCSCMGSNKSDFSH